MTARSQFNRQIRKLPKKYFALSLLSAVLLSWFTMGSPTAPAAQDAGVVKTSFKFDFGTDRAKEGYLNVTPEMVYTPERGYGLDFGTQATALDRGGDPLSGNLLTSAKPFYFSVDVPEGNYDVTVTLGDPDEEALTTIFAETRRPTVISLKTAKGQIETRTFTVNVHNSYLKNGNQIKLTDREKKNGPNGSMFLHLDGQGDKNKLTLQFLDKRPCVGAVEIVKNNDAVTLYLCGDSTVTDQPSGQFCSWGQTLPLFFKPKLAAVSNHAESGRTSAAFLGERRLDKIADLIKAGDYLFVHFAHNDSHDPGGVPIPAYKNNIKKFIDLAHTKGATPILITTMNRLGFDANGKAKADLARYAEAMREVAKENNEFLIDLNKMSIEFYEALGPTKGKLAFKSGDSTHSAFYGSYEFSRFIAEQIKESPLPLAKLVVDDLPKRNYEGPSLSVPGF